jgi:uncharacterized protein DUF6686
MFVISIFVNMCEFQSLYFGEDGYVVRCRECNHYQLAFCRTMLTLTEGEFQEFRSIVEFRYTEIENSFIEPGKSIILETPLKEVHMLLSPIETRRFLEILEHADTELKAQGLINLFSL